MNFVNTKPNLTDADFLGVEAVLGFRLPNELRAHYLQFNGGHPMRNLFPKDGEYYAVQEFLPIKYGVRGESLEDTYKSVVVGNERFPSNMIPIAYDAGGDYFCYCLRANGLGEIYFFQSEYFENPARALVFLAKNLHTFLESLVNDE